MNRYAHAFVSVLAVLFAATASAAPGQAGSADATGAPKKVYRWVGCGITKKAFMKELAAAYARKTGVTINIEGGGATRGIREVAAAKADIGGSCRPKIPDHPGEIGAELRPVAWDALVVIVHPNNPVNNITMEQLRGIYLGQIRNWQALGGADGPIHLIVRRGKISGVGLTLRKLVFANFDQDFINPHKIVKSSGPLEKTIESDPYAIGVTGISSARKRRVKILKLEGKAPTYENIRSGAYLLYRPLYLVLNPSHPDYPALERLVRFAHSPEGRAVIRANGTVPYLDAIRLVMKEAEQERMVRRLGLYTR